MFSTRLSICAALSNQLRMSALTRRLEHLNDTHIILSQNARKAMSSCVPSLIVCAAGVDSSGQWQRITRVELNNSLRIWYCFICGKSNVTSSHLSSAIVFNVLYGRRKHLCVLIRQSRLLARRDREVKKAPATQDEFKYCMRVSVGIHRPPPATDFPLCLWRLPINMPCSFLRSFLALSHS